MADFFFFGTLCHPPLLAAVLGRHVATEPAELPDHAVYWATGQSFPVIIQRKGSVAQGVLARGLNDADVARLDYYEGGFDYCAREMELAGSAVRAKVYFCAPDVWKPGDDWQLEDWVLRFGNVTVATALDFMSLMGEKPARQVSGRYGMMMVRGASRVRAAVPTPATLRHAAVPGDVAVVAKREPYANFFAVEEYELRYRRFDGAMGDVISRAAFVSGDAATVLPYDPVRDRVMVIEQFRMGAFARGDSNPWLVEAIAGRVDPDETPQDAARREALEEAGIVLGALTSVAEYYPSPGAKTEFLYSFVGLADLPDSAPRVGGLAGEHEDIRAHIISFDALMDLIARGEGANGPLILTALWLAAHRDEFRTAC